MTVNFMQMFISSLLGGVLGILFLIPFRKYFVKEKHGEYPFPEATASTQVLVSGEKGGDQAKPLLLAGLVGGLYDFIVGTLDGGTKTLPAGYADGAKPWPTNSSWSSKSIREPQSWDWATSWD